MAADFDRKALKEDAFQDTMFHVVDWAYKRRKWIIGAVVAVVAAGAGTYGYMRYQAAQLQEQALAFYQAEQSGADPALSDAERATRSRDAMAAFVAEYPGSTLAPVAWQHIARLAWRLEEADAARTAYQAVLSHRQSTPAQKDLAHFGLGTVEEAAGNLDAAAAHYEAVSDTAYGSLKALSLGRIASARGAGEEARAQYEKAAREKPGTQLAEWARQSLDYHP